MLIIYYIIQFDKYLWKNFLPYFWIGTNKLHLQIPSFTNWLHGQSVVSSTCNLQGQCPSFLYIPSTIFITYSLSGFNFSRLNKNHTWDLESNLNEDKSLAYIKSLQVKSIDDLRNTNILFKLVVPKKYKESFKINSKDNDNTLKSLYVNAENPIFIYSAGPNDFFTYIKAGPVELTDENVRAKLPKDIRPILEQCISNVEKNWQLLHQLNPNVKIYSLSYYYSPLYDTIKKFFNRLLGWE